MAENLALWLTDMGAGATLANVISNGLSILLLIVVGLVSYWVTRLIVTQLLARVIVRSPVKWDDALQAHKVPAHAAHLVPALVLYALIPLVFRGKDTWITGLEGLVLIYLILIGLWVANGLLNALLDILRGLEVSRELPLAGLVQVVKLALAVLAIVLVVSIVINRTALYVLGGLGALSAVLMLVFKDPILGFAAGLQLTANKLLARGDWIEMPRYDATGEVLEVGLTTVKVRNADKSITTIPTYALISESFKNWRGLREAGVRRIMRAVLIDVNSVRFCTEEMLARFSRLEPVSPWIGQQQTGTPKPSRGQETGGESQGGSRTTNLAAYRAYVQSYLESHPAIAHDLNVVVRLLAPTEYGLPVEIYAYCREIDWVPFEAVQAEILEHIVAVAPEFDLRVFQYPGRTDG